MKKNYLISTSPLWKKKLRLVLAMCVFLLGFLGHFVSAKTPGEDFLPLRGGITLKSTGIFSPVFNPSENELVFSTVKGVLSTPDTIRLENTGSGNLEVQGLTLGTSLFEVLSPSSLPLNVPAGASLDIVVRFTPSATDVGALNDVLQIQTNQTPNPTIDIFLYGLSTNGLEGNFEPSLADVFTTLGYGVDVGWTGLLNPNGTSPVLSGDEQLIQLFRKAGAGTVSLVPIARYSPSEILPFGYYFPNGNTPQHLEIGRLGDAGEEHQTLNPPLLSGNPQFDPGSGLFGIFTESQTFGRFIYTEDELNLLQPNNPTNIARRSKVYPAKDRNGNLIANTYLITLEDATNGDYQDYIYVLSNVEPVFISQSALFVDKAGFEVQDYVSAGAQTATLSIDNLGDAPLNISSLNLNGADAGAFSLPNGENAFSIPANASYSLQIAFNANFEGIHQANLVITSDDQNTPGNVENVALRGLGINAGVSEPSLQSILGFYNISINVGDDNPNTAEIHSQPVFQSATLLGDELDGQTFRKAGTGDVSIEPLAIFSPSGVSTIMEAGWYYEIGNPVEHNTLFSISQTQAESNQSTLVNPVGSLTFDPGDTLFGLFTEWMPRGNRRVYSEDIDNTFTNSIPHHARVYTLRNSLGDSIPNAFVVAFEEHTTDFDFQDFVMIIRNVELVESVDTPSYVQFNPDMRELIVPQNGLQNFTTDLNEVENSIVELTLFATDLNTSAIPTWLSPVNGNGTDWETSFIHDSNRPELTFQIDATGLTPGFYEAEVIARASGNFIDDTLKVEVTVVDPTIPLADFQVNFMDKQTVTPIDWLRDIGEPYGPRTDSDQGGLTYGWKRANAGTLLNLTANGKNRWKWATEPDQVVTATTFFMQYDDINAGGAVPIEGYWEVDVPNGFYDVTVSAGEVTNIEGHMVINAEGVNVLDFIPNSDTLYLVQTATVMVTDGVLTVDAFGGFHTKIQWIRVQPSMQQLTFNPAQINVELEYGNNTAQRNAQLISDPGVPSGLELTQTIGTSWLGVPAAGVGNLSFDFDASGLPPGTYNTTVRASAPGYDDGELLVSMKVLPLGMDIVQDTLRFSLDRGSNSASQAIDLTVAQGSPTDIRFQKGLEDTWLTLPGNGVVGSNNISVQTDGLVPDTYYATVTAISSGYADASVVVELQVNDVSDLTNIPPVVEVTLTGQNYLPGVFKNEAVATLEATAVNGSGISSLEYSFDGVNWEPYLNPLYLNEPGFYSLQARATDNNALTTISGTYDFEVRLVPLYNNKMVLENRDKFPEDDELAFSRIQNRWYGINGNTPAAESHDRVTLRIHNRGLGNLTIDDLIVSNPNYWAINKVFGSNFDPETSLPISISSNEFVDVEMKFIAVDPPNPRSNGIKVLHETLTIVSNDDETPVREVQLHGLWQRNAEGNNEPLANDILAAFGLTIDIGFTRNKRSDIVTPTGDEVIAPNFVRVDQTKPVYVRQLAAYHSCCWGFYSVDIFYSEDLTQKGGTKILKNKGIGVDSQSILPRKNTKGGDGIYGDPADGTISPSVPFNVTIQNDNTNRFLNTDSLVGIRVWKLRNSKGEIVPNSFILANDAIGNASNWDYNDNLFVITNVRPENGTGYSSTLVSGNGIPADQDEKQSALDLGEAMIGDQVNRTVYLRSLGQIFPEDDDPDIVISNIEVIGPDRTEFVATMPTKTTLLPHDPLLNSPDQTSFNLAYMPNSTGLKNAALLIHYNSDASPMRIPLSAIAQSSCFQTTVVRRIKNALDIGVSNTTIGGVVWETDQTYKDGSGFKLDTFADSYEVAETDIDPLYSRYMSSVTDLRPISYQFPGMAAGNYTVRLHFAEMYWSQTNDRVNDIIVEGETRIQGLDIIKEVGDRTALVKDIDVEVNDGTLNLTLNPIVNRPAISAIEIYRNDYNNSLSITTDLVVPTECDKTNGIIEVSASGAANIEYKLGKFGPYQASGRFENLRPGIYTMYAKDADSDCEITTEVTVEGLSSIDFVITPSLAGCDLNDKAAAAVEQITGGIAPYTVIWNNNPLTSGLSLDGLSVGQYFVTVFDANGCSNTKFFNIVRELNCPIRINSGEENQNFLTKDGREFIPDVHFSGGRISGVNNNDEIQNTEDDKLFRLRRIDAFSYNIPVAFNGEYEVKLYFNEPSKNGSSQRRFHVEIEGTRVLNNFDIYLVAGGRNRAVIRTFSTVVNDGKLDIDFLTGSFDDPTVSAVEVTFLGNPSNTAPVVITPISDQSTLVGQVYTYTVPNGAYLDLNGDSLDITASLVGGSPLPAWLSYDPLTNTFTGTPDDTDIGELDIQLTIADPIGAFVIDVFKLRVEDIQIDVQQIARKIIPGAENKEVLRVAITSPENFSVASLLIRTTGTSDLNDVKKAKVFYTGNAATYFNAALFGLEVDVTSNEFVIGSVPQNLSSGTHYFWVVMDIDSNATSGNLIDAEVVSVGLNSIDYAVASGNPAGERIIAQTEHIPGFLMNLDGIDDAIQIEKEGRFDLNSEITLEAWIRTNDVRNQEKTIISKGNSAWKLSLANDGKLQFGLDGLITMLGTSDLADGEWHHVAGSYDGTEMSICIDGVLENQQALVGNFNTNNLAVQIGNNPEVSNSYFEGDIDEVRVWSVGRSLKDIRESIYLTLYGLESGLLGYWQFNEVAGTEAEELSNGLYGTLQGALGRQIANEPIGGGASFTATSLANGTVSFTDTDLEIDFGAIHPQGELVVTRIDSLAPAGTDPDPSAEKAISYWVIRNYGSNVSGLSPMTLRFTLPTGSLLSANVADYNMYKRPSNATDTWPEIFMATGIDMVQDELEFTGITSFSQVMIAGQLNGSLPVSLISFVAERKNDKQVDLFWQTAAEQENVGFEVQKSADGQNFERIGFVDGAGNSTVLRSYQFADNFASQSAYYRLKQVDTDGSFTYSEVRFVEGPDATGMGIYPNPVRDEVNFQASEGLRTVEGGSAQLYDRQGRLILRLSGSLAEMEANLSSRVNQLASGWYVLRMLVNGEQHTLKMMKQ